MFAIAREPESSRPGDHEARRRRARAGGDDWQPCTRSALELPPKTTPTRVVRRGLGREHAVARAARDRRATATTVGYRRRRDRARQRPRRAAPPAPRRTRSRAAEALPLRVQPDRHPVRQRRDLLRVAGGRQPLARGAAAQLERKRRARQRAGARDRARRRRRDLGGDLRRAGPLRRPELAAARARRSWPRAGSPPTARARVWVATGKGLRMLPAAAAAPAPTRARPGRPGGRHARRGGRSLRPRLGDVDHVDRAGRAK